MPSRAEIRVRAEQVLRGIVIAVLAVMLWRSLHQAAGSGGQIVRARRIGRDALANWSALPTAPAGFQLLVDNVPSPIERAWLGGLAGAGSSVTWSGDLPSLMIDAQPIAAPVGGTTVLLATPRASSVVMSDAVGVIDTLRSQNGGAALSLNSVASRLTAGVTGSVASTAAGDSVVLHKVLVIGEAGWESKFVVAALEEEGWKVDAFIRVAPGVDVTQGSAAAIDTSRYTAVVALDAAATPYANRIVEFARTGGGVVLASGAASVDAMSPLRAGVVGRATSPVPASVGIASLALVPITAFRSDGVPIERRNGSVAIAARRIGAGRAIQVGYEDTWRWRMNGDEGAVREHRLWWTRLVSSVAYAPQVSGAAASTSTDETPMIGLVAALGPGTLEGARSSLPGNPSERMPWLFVLLALALVGEVASRRLRGAS